MVFVIKFKGMKRISFILVLTLILFPFFSCTADIVIDVKKAADGNVELQVNLDPILTRYIFDLQSTFTNVSPEEAEQLFDPAKTKELLEKSKTVSVVSMDSSNKNKIKMKLAFKPLEQVVDEGDRLLEKEIQKQIRKVMDLKVAKNGIKTATFHLDKDNFESLINVIPPEAQPLVAIFAPPGYKVDRDEYLEALKLNFIAYDSEYIGEEIKKSKLKMKIHFEGELISASGGTLKGKTLNVEVPLMDLLLLEKPFEFEIQFR